MNIESTSSEVIEGDVLIREFMGEDKCPYGVGANQVHKDDLKYHSDWNWLMGVVEKIENMDQEKPKNYFPYRFHIEGNSCLVTNNGNSIHERFWNYSSKIRTVWLSVIEFIKWYNSQKQ